MPPCYRRTYLAWQRGLLHLEISLGQFYLNWTQSPAWNFVGIVGCVGIILTILLFLSPWDSPSRKLSASIDSLGSSRSASHRPWELDARLVEATVADTNDYAVEVAFIDTSNLKRRASTAAFSKTPNRRLSPGNDQFRPTKQTHPANSDIDWFNEERVADEPPVFEVDVEFVPRNRRPIHEPKVPEVTLTARTDVIDQELADRRFGRRFRNDYWQEFDPVSLDRQQASEFGHTDDDQTIAASLDVKEMNARWEPWPIPESAASTVDVNLELSWENSGRRSALHRTGPRQLHIRNRGFDAVPHVDVIYDFLRETDFTVPQPLKSQSLPELAAGEEQIVRRFESALSARTISVLVTAFVGNRTSAIAAAVKQVPHAEPEPTRDEVRPHLTLSVGQPSLLSKYSLYSTPLKVVNDGNVRLDGVIIVAEIPPSLEHRFGHTVHLLLGPMQPREERRTYLLLTPLQPGSATVLLNVSDRDNTATDSGKIPLEISAGDLPELPSEKVSARVSPVEDVRPRYTRRRLASSRTPGTFSEQSDSKSGL